MTYDNNEDEFHVNISLSRQKKFVYYLITVICIN